MGQKGGEITGAQGLERRMEKDENAPCDNWARRDKDRECPRIEQCR